MYFIVYVHFVGVLDIIYEKNAPNGKLQDVLLGYKE
jgi:hypothetical protein